MEAGIQLHLPTYKDIPMPELVNLAKAAESGGISQIWATDNLQSRNVFVVLAALASHVGVNLGTAVTVQYFRNPVDLADSVAAISEIMDGGELSIGIARGNPYTPNLISTARPVSMLAPNCPMPEGTPGRGAGEIQRLPCPGFILQLQS